MSGADVDRETPERADWQVGDTIADLYDVRSVLGEGGFGRVYCLYHRRWHLELAVKTPNAATLARSGGSAGLEREAETWVQLAPHPNVVTCHYLRRLNDIPRVFIEHVGGGDLHQWIRSGRLYEGGPKAALARILDVAIQFAWGLHHAHEARMIHQDVKPANVLMTEDGVAKVTDFGLATVQALQDGDGDTLVAGVTGYTPLYASPEQMAKGQLTRRTDTWSWAVSVLEMFIGERTWPIGSVAGYYLEQLIESGPPAEHLPRMPAPLAGLLGECFSEDEAARPQTLGLVADRLVGMYTLFVGEPYPRDAFRVDGAQADALNNRALSFLDLGKPELAHQAFAEGLALDPGHPQCTFNSAVMRWRRGETTDDGVVEAMEDVLRTTRTPTDTLLMLAQLHLERGDCLAAEAALARVPARDRGRKEVLDLGVVARESTAGSRRCVARLELDAPIAAAAVDEASHLAAFGVADGELRLVDTTTEAVQHRLRAHHEPVSAMALSSDGRTLATGSADGGARAWDVETGRALRTHTDAHAFGVTCLAMHPEGRCFVTGGADHSVGLWSGRAEHDPVRFTGHGAPVTGVGIAPSARTVVSASKDGTLRLWSVEGGERARVDAHAGGVAGLAVRPDFSVAASVGADGGLRVWALDSLQSTVDTRVPDARFTCVAIAPRVPIVATGDRLGRVRIFELKRGRCVHTIAAANEPIVSVSLTGGGVRVVLAAGRTLLTWALRKDFRYTAPRVMCQVRSTDELREFQQAFDGHLADASTALEAGDVSGALRHALAARGVQGFGQRPEIMSVWRRLARFHAHPHSRGAWPMGTVDAHAGPVRVLVPSRDGAQVFSAAADGTVALWDTQTLTLVQSWTPGVVTSAIALFRAGEVALFGGEDGRLRHVHLRTGETMTEWPAHETPVRRLRVSFDGRLAVSAGDGGRVRVWDIATGTRLREFTMTNGAVTGIDLSRDARQVVVVGDDRRLRVWDLASAKLVDQFGPREGFVDPVVRAQFSEDGQWLAILDRKGVLWRWATDRSAPPRRVHALDLVPADAALAGDGLAMAIRDDKGAAHVVPLADDQPPRALDGHAGALTTLAFVDNRSLLFAGDEEGRLVAWQLDWELDPGAGALARGKVIDAHVDLFARQQVPTGVPLPQEHTATEHEIDEALAWRGRPRWRDADIDSLRVRMADLGLAGVDRDEVAERLRRVVAEWPLDERPDSEIRAPEAMMSSVAPPEPVPVATAPPRPVTTIRPASRATSGERRGGLPVRAIAVVVALAIGIGWFTLSGPKDEAEVFHEIATALSQGADPLMLDGSGDAAIHRAAEDGHESVVHLLLVSGTPVNTRNADGWTALHVAAANGHLAAAQVLRNGGANLKAKTRAEGMTALQLAADGGHGEMVRWLRQF